MIIMIVIAIVVTYFSFGTLAPEMSSMIGGMVVGTTAAGATLTLGGVVAAGFIAGAAGSIASQAAGSAMGVAHFSWKQVAVDATVNALTEGFGAWGATTATFGEAGSSMINDARQLSTLGRVAQAVVGYGAMVGASVAVGRDANFSWKAVAATAVGSFLSAELGGKVPTLQGGSPLGGFINNFEGYLVNGTVNAATRSAFGVGTFNWGQIAADAFGNALGSAAINAISSVQQQQAKASTPFGGGQPYFGPSLFGNASGSDPFSTQAFGVSAAPTSAFAGANPFGGTANASLGLFGGFGDWGSAGVAAGDNDRQSIPNVSQQSSPDTTSSPTLDLAGPVGESILGASPTRKITTGYGDAVDALAEKSPTFLKLWNEKQQAGVTIVTGTDPNTVTDSNITSMTITLNPDVLANPNEIIRVLSHELAHIFYKNPMELYSNIQDEVGSSMHDEFVNRYVNGYLLDEGEAKLTEIDVQKEIGVDIGALRDNRPVVGSGAEYTSIYAQLSSGSITRDDARQQIADIIANTDPNHMQITYAQMYKKGAENEWNRYVNFSLETIQTDRVNINILNKNIASINANIAYMENLGQISPNNPLFGTVKNDQAEIAAYLAYIRLHQQQINSTPKH